MAQSTHNPEPQPPQFGLRSIFAATAVFAVILGTFRWLGFWPTVGLLLVAIATITAYAAPTRRASKWIAVTGVLFVTALLIVLALPPPHSTDPRGICRNNLKAIAIGLQTYADVHGSLPPAYVADEQGRPMHSWRVLILPFIEEKWLYDQYNFNEPWDGPHNRSLAKHMPPMYRCPSDTPWSPPTTSYLAVTGKETVWPGTDSTAFSDVTDGLSDTIAVVEVAHSGVNWMEPRDLPLAEFVKGINRSGAVGASSHHRSGPYAAWCDGHVEFLQDGLPTATLKALATRANDDSLPRDKYGNRVAH